MSRYRVAIAHFSSSKPALRTRVALIGLGGDALMSMEDGAGAVGPCPCRLEVTLPPMLERRLLNVLLNSEAVRVDVHDA